PQTFQNRQITCQADRESGKDEVEGDGECELDASQKQGIKAFEHTILRSHERKLAHESRRLANCKFVSQLMRRVFDPSSSLISVTGAFALFRNFPQKRGECGHS